jgi:hypothetical protein
VLLTNWIEKYVSEDFNSSAWWNGWHGRVEGKGIIYKLLRREVFISAESRYL